MKYLNKILFFITLTTSLQAQVSFESFNPDSLSHRKKRFSFAHMYFGLEGFNTQSGQTSVLSANNQLSQSTFSGYTVPRLMWGGTHFWGHADIYLSFPIGGYKKTIPKELQAMDYNMGVETGIKYYPWTVLKNHKLRPYVGIAWNIASFSQQQNGKEASISQFKNTTPLLLGLGFKHKKWLIEGGLQYFYNHRMPYPITPTIEADIELPKTAFVLSSKFLLETTAQSKDYIKKRMTNLKEHKKFSTFYVGIGPSGTTSIQSKSSFDQAKYPFLANQKRYYGIIPDITAGYFFSKAELNVGLAYRKMKNGFTGFGVSHYNERQSLMLESYKFLFDYHGFVPYLGLTGSRENLYFASRDKNADNKWKEYRQTKYPLGVVFGWDIRPTRAESWLLRTNLRYTPLQMDVEDKKVAFDYLEFNFIQLVLFPERIIVNSKKRTKTL
jgi:outer membrane protein W